MIYFLQSGKDGPIKIGHTETHINSRLRVLRNSSAYELFILGLEDGGHGYEKELHRRFKAHQFRGEWFNPVPELLKHIENAGGVEAYHRLDRTDLRKAISRASVRLWDAKTRAELRAVLSSLDRPFTAWREYMDMPTDKVCRAIESFLISKGQQHAIHYPLASVSPTTPHTTEGGRAAA